MKRAVALVGVVDVKGESDLRLVHAVSCRPYEEGHDVVAESKRLVGAARAAIDELQPYVIRHGIDDLSASERMHFGAAGTARWDIATPPASTEDIQLLLRMGRLLQLLSPIGASVLSGCVDGSVFVFVEAGPFRQLPLDLLPLPQCQRFDR